MSERDPLGLMSPPQPDLCKHGTKLGTGCPECTREFDNALFEARIKNAARDKLAGLAAVIASGGMPTQQGQLINADEIADDAVAIARAIMRKVLEVMP